MNSSALAAIETIRQRWLFIHCGVGAPATAKTGVAPAIEKMDAYVDTYMAKQTWEPGSPEHGNPLGRPLTQAEIAFGPDVFHYLHQFASAWRCPFSRHFQNPEVLEHIIAGVRFGERYVRPDQPKDGSWHAWDIAIPGRLCQILLMCDDHIPDDLRQLIMEDLEYMPARVFKLDRLKGIYNRPVSSGSNDLTILYQAMMRGLILRDPQWLDTIMTQIHIVMGRAEGSEGLQSDWSYQFHGHGINAGYGGNSLIVQGQWIYLVQGTPWAVPDSVRELHVGMFREFFARNIWRGRSAPYTIDRGIATPLNIYAHGFLGAILLGFASNLPPQDNAVFAASAKDYFLGLGPDGKPGMPGMTDFGGNLLLSRVEQPIQGDLSVLEGMRYYPESEYLLVREPHWFASVRMSSGRTKAWNSMLGYNIHASAMAEFAIAFMTDGREFDHTTITTMNWKRLMGVTRCDAIEQPPECYAQSAFCGGLAGDEFAVLGLQYLLAPADQDTLRAHKSLFFTPEAIVLLGSKIRCDSDEPVVTTLFHAPLITDGPYLHNQQPLNVEKDGVWEFKAGDTLYLRNVGVRLLCDAQLTIETREGSYAGLNMPQTWEHEHEKPFYDTVYKLRWVYLVINHGVRPKNGRYGALLFPLAKPDQLPAVENHQIVHEDLHHRVSAQNGAVGGEVRFPGDWRKKIGMSYWGAEQHQWGSIARWVPGDDADHAQLEMLPCRRFVRDEMANTEIFLPDGFEQENVTLKTYAGTPFPANLMSLPANGKVRKVRARIIKR